MKRFISLIYILVSCFFSFSQVEITGYNFDQGLPNNTSEIAFHDSYGYVWIGTYGGLSKFDGYTFENYTIFDTVCPIPGNTIFSIFEDSDSTLWIGTNEGLVIYNRKTDCLETLPIRSMCVNRITENDDSTLWVASYSGLFVVDRKSRTIIKEFTEKSALRSHSITDLCFDALGNIWIGTSDISVVKLNIKTGIFSFLQLNTTEKIGKNIKSLAFDKNNKLWIGTADAGIFVLDTASGAIKKYLNPRNEEMSMGYDYVSKILVDSKQQLWIIRNGVINKYNEPTDEIVRYIPSTLNERFHKAKSICSFAEDRHGNFWIGTYEAGIFYLNNIKNKFTVYSKIPENSKKETLLKAENIRAIVPLKNELVLASDGGGISYFNTQTKTSRLFANERLGSQKIMYVAKNENTLWCATWGNGLWSIDTKTNTTKRILFYDTLGNELSIYNIRYVQLIDSILWLGTSGHGVHFYNIKTNKFVSGIFNNTFDFAKTGWISCIYCDSKNRIWVTSFDRAYVVENKTVTIFEKNLKQKNTLSDDVVNAVFEDSNQNIWLLTSKGLDKFNETDNSFTHVDLIPGKPSYPRAVLEDNNQILWISSELGIFRYNQATNNIRSFNKNKGMLDAEFNLSSAYKAPDGTLYFGNKKGFISFNPDTFLLEKNSPQVAIRNLYIDYKLQKPNKNSILSAAVAFSDTITLQQSKSILSFEIVDLNHLLNTSATFSYSINELNTGWITIDESRTITYSNLPQGTYHIQVKVCYDNGICSEKQLALIVTPLWWQTILFKIVLVLFSFGLIFLIFRIRINIIRTQNRILKRKVEEQTESLVQINNKLVAKNNNLQESELLLQIKNDELATSNATKDKLFSIVAHDLKNPLTVITGFSELLFNSSNIQGKQKTQISSIFKASNNMLAQINTLLNWSRSQTNTLQYNPENITIETLIRENITLSIETASLKETELHFNSCHTHNAYADKEMIQIVFRNLLTNAIKFTPRHGIITIETSNSPEYTCIDIKDTGVGMSQEVVNTLFTSVLNKSTRGTDNEHGTGLGLLICRDLLNINNAKIEVTSQLNKGSSFKIFLPKGEPVSEIATQLENISTQLPLVSDQQIDDIELKPILLIVDDNIEILNYIVSIFSPYYIIETAQNGNEGFKKALELVPNLIISDLKMPEKDGLEMCLQIKEEPVLNHIPLLILSAQNEFDMQLKSIEVGALDFIPKPFNKQMLFLKVKTLLEAREKYKLFLKAQVETQAPSLIERPEHRFIASIDGVLEKFYRDSEFGVERFASEMSYSRSQLFRKLKATIDITPVEYLKIYRLKRAKEMIDAGYTRVSEIAYEVGFSDPLYFSTCFKSQYGAPPNQFIKKV